MRRDPYRVLEVSPNASAEELHDAYRRLVKLHHPDRNGGSDESARRFAEIQEAYEAVRSRPRPSRTASRAAAGAAESVKERMATLERELREAQAARDAVREGDDNEPAPITTEDSIGRILGDIRDEVADRVSDGLKHPAVKRVSDLIDDVVSRVDRRP